MYTALCTRVRIIITIIIIIVRVYETAGRGDGSLAKKREKTCPEG